MRQKKASRPAELGQMFGRLRQSSASQLFFLTHHIYELSTKETDSKYKSMCTRCQFQIDNNSNYGYCYENYAAMPRMNINFTMLKRIIISLILIHALSPAVFSEARKEKVLIYNLPVIYEKSIIIDEDKKGEQDRHDYYSFIIPHAIAQNLNASGKIEAQKIDGELPLKDIGSDAFYSEMRKIGAEYSARYLIGGRATFKRKKLTIELAVVNVKENDFTGITKETFETGAELKTVITDLTSEIEKILESSIAIAERREKPIEKREEKKEEPAVSPFLKGYRAMENLSFGAKTGRIFIKGSFSKLYDDFFYVSPYLSYGILTWLGVSAGADYLSAENGSKIVRRNSTMLMWGVTINADFSYRFFEHFGVMLSAGFGTSFGRIYLRSSDNPFDGLVKQKYSIDPYLNISASFNLLFRPIELQFGGGYKSAFFKGKPLSLLAVFFGIGYHL